MALLYTTNNICAKTALSETLNVENIFVDMLRAVQRNNILPVALPIRLWIVTNLRNYSGLIRFWFVFCMSWCVFMVTDSAFEWHIREATKAEMLWLHWAGTNNMHEYYYIPNICDMKMDEAAFTYSMIGIEHGLRHTIQISQILILRAPIQTNVQQLFGNLNFPSFYVCCPKHTGARLVAG